jgi:restriction system protein
MSRKPSKTKNLASKVIFEAFRVLKEAGGEMNGREVLNKIRINLEFSDWETERYEKTGYIRWESILHFFTIDCVKAGFLRKNKGTWILTDEGEKAMELGPEKMLDKATAKYREWKKTQDAEKEAEIPDEEETQSQQALIDKYEEEALDGIKEYLARKNPYEFQDMVAALLQAMGYYTPHIATRGKDGGIDIIAYVDPLGTKQPRIKVQVKHRPDYAVSVDDIRQLVGLLNRVGDVGLFVTSGRFTSEAERAARESHLHIELINFTRLINLWQEYYPKFDDETKNMLPMQAIYFLGVNE